MFIHNINPVLVSFGPFEIRYYGLVFLVGFLLTYYVVNKRRQELDLTKNDVESFIMYLVLGVILGARLFEVFVWEPGYYLSNPSQIIAVWKGGLSLHGGLIGAVITSYYFCRKHNIKLSKLADIVTLPALFGLALGRIANFINAELVGRVTNVPWCFKFPGYEGCRHPVQLYGAGGRFVLFGFLAWLNKKNWKDGFIFWVFIFFMGLGRFFSDFYRDDPTVFGLNTGQYLSILMFLAAGFVLLKYYRHNLFKQSTSS